MKEAQETERNEDSRRRTHLSILNYGGTLGRGEQHQHAYLLHRPAHTCHSTTEGGVPPVGGVCHQDEKVPDDPGSFLGCDGVRSAFVTALMWRGGRPAWRSGAGWRLEVEVCERKVAAVHRGDAEAAVVFPSRGFQLCEVACTRELSVVMQRAVVRVAGDGLANINTCRLMSPNGL